MIAKDAPDFNPGMVTMQGVDTSPFRAGRELEIDTPDFSPGRENNRKALEPRTSVRGAGRNIYEKNEYGGWIGMTERNWKILGAIALVALGVVGRVLLRQFVPAGGGLIMFDLFAVVGIIAVLSGVILGGAWSFIVPLGAMAVSDLILGNGLIFVFTWSGFAMMGGLGLMARKDRAASSSFGLKLAGFGVAGILAFDMWTNLGWWLLSPMYPHNAAGLAACYAMGLPFMVGHLLTTAAVIPIAGLAAIYVADNRARLSSALRARFGSPSLS